MSREQLFNIKSLKFCEVLKQPFGIDLNGLLLKSIACSLPNLENQLFLMVWSWLPFNVSFRSLGVLLKHPSRIDLILLLCRDK